MLEAEKSPGLRAAARIRLLTKFDCGHCAKKIEILLSPYAQCLSSVGMWQADANARDNAPVAFPSTQ
jgi:hypothetical protein